MLGQFTKQKFTQIVLFLTLLSSFFCLAETLPTPNLSRSLDLQRHYENLAQGDKVLQLATSDEQFIGIHLEQRTNQPQGGVLILHDVGHTPDWPFLLQQTRQYLPDVGWTTLAIDLPTPMNDAIGHWPLGDDASNTEATPMLEDWQTRIMLRIAAGIKHLNDEGLFNLVILGYGDGAYWGATYLAERLSEEEEAGYALIVFEAPLNYGDLAETVGQLSIPTLDIYMNDSDFAQHHAKLRKAAAARADHPDYLQIHDAARHGHLSKPDIDRSTRRVWGWLKNHAAGYEATLVNKTVN